MALFRKARRYNAEAWDQWCRGGLCGTGRSNPEKMNDSQGHDTDRQIPKIFLAYKEVAWSLGIGERNLRTMVSRGQLPVIELGGKVLFDPDDLHDLKRKRKTVRNQAG